MPKDMGIDESMRLNWSKLNNGLIKGMQAVIMLKFIDALHGRQVGISNHLKGLTYWLQIVGST